MLLLREAAEGWRSPFAKTLPKKPAFEHDAGAILARVEDQLKKSGSYKPRRSVAEVSKVRRCAAETRPMFAPEGR